MSVLEKPVMDREGEKAWVGKRGFLNSFVCPKLRNTFWGKRELELMTRRDLKENDNPTAGGGTPSGETCQRRTPTPLKLKPGPLGVGTKGGGEVRTPWTYGFPRYS